jgi:hypothetical protein
MDVSCASFEVFFEYEGFQSGVGGLLSSLLFRALCSVSWRMCEPFKAAVGIDDLVLSRENMAQANQFRKHDISDHTHTQDSTAGIKYINSSLRI